MLRARIVPSPIGELKILSDQNDVVTHILFPDQPLPSNAVVDPTAAAAAANQLEEYFAGKRGIFDFKFQPAGTGFQQEVWKELLNIPFGTTVSYADVARKIGRPAAARAVGAANGSNPIPIVIPCHRVIGSNGTLTGYGGGLDIKRKLLEQEGVLSVTLF
jgi:methylated-DNA-[protein]-cysteine S-methyltransferase